MADKIKVNTARLGTDAGSVASYIKAIRTETDHMKSSIRWLDNMWDGPGSEAFKKAFQDDMKAMADVISYLESIHTYEINAKAEYENCEKKVASLISEIKV